MHHTGARNNALHTNTTAFTTASTTQYLVYII